MRYLKIMKRVDNNVMSYLNIKKQGIKESELNEYLCFYI